MAELAIVELSELTPAEDRRLLEGADAHRRARAERARYPEDARRCLVAGALLEYAVNKELGGTPVQIARTAKGKPYLPEHPDFHFNLSHSGNFVVIAWGECPLGVDIQRMEPHRDWAGLARRHYTPREQDYVFSGDDGLRRFYQVWTAKESYLKYLGVGLDRALDSFCVIQGLPGVELRSRFVKDYCLTLCAQNPELPLTYLKIADILP